MSAYLFTKLPDFLIKEKREQLTPLYKQFKPSFLSAWETQALWQDVIGLYDETVVRKLNTIYTKKIQKSATIIRYKVNPKFHRDLDRYSLNANQTVTYKNNKFRLGLLREAETPTFSIKPIREIGVDVGFARHFFTCTTEENERISFKSSEGYIEGLVEKLTKIDEMMGECELLRKSGQHLKAKDKHNLAQKRLKNIISKNQWFMESLVSQFLTTMIKKGFTDIITLAGTAKVSGLRLTRMVRMLRLSSFKSMIEAQAQKKGVRVHLVHAQCSSQECSHCHHTSKLNRKGEVFKCTVCGHTNEADFQSGGNLLSRKLYCQQLIKKDLYGRYHPIMRTNNQIKEVFQNNQKPYPFSECFGNEKVLVLEPKIMIDGSLRCIVLPEPKRLELKSD